MPIYEFECSKCCHVFERFMKMEEDHSGLTCPACGAKDPKKIVSLVQNPDFKRLGKRIWERMQKRQAGE